jgi:hypothetical protein
MASFVLLDISGASPMSSPGAFVEPEAVYTSLNE